MSQAGIINTGSGPVPPTVATSYVTDVNSPAIPAANILNVLGNDTTVDDPDGIRTDGSSGSNTLTVQLTNRLKGSGSSTNAVPVDLVTFALASSSTGTPTPQSYRFNFDVVGRHTTTGDTVGYSVDGTAKTDGVMGVAVASMVATPFIDNDEDASLVTADIDLIASGNSVILRATGIANDVGPIINTITYKTVGTYVVV
jgi:hypothetical protein